MIPSARPYATIICPNCKKTLYYIPGALTVGEILDEVCYECGGKFKTEVTESGLKLLEVTE